MNDFVKKTVSFVIIYYLLPSLWHYYITFKKKSSNHALITSQTGKGVRGSKSEWRKKLSQIKATKLWFIILV